MTPRVNGDLPFALRTPEGIRWRLADRCWSAAATGAARAMSGQADQDAEVLKDGRNRFIFRLPGQPSVVVKSFPMSSLKQRLLRYRRYGPAEAANLMKAASLQLPVPAVYGYGELRRLGMVLTTAIIMEDIQGVLIGDVLQAAGGDAGDQGRILDTLTPLFVALYRAGCNHIDVNRHSVFLSDGGQVRIIDFQWVRFLPRPSVEVLIAQMGRLRQSCGPIVPPDVFRSWVERVVKAAGIEPRQSLIDLHERFATTELSRKRRLSLR